MPIFILNTLGNAAVVIGNSDDWKSEPAFVYVNATNLGFISVIDTFSEIPDEIRPKEYLPSKIMKGTSWETAMVQSGLTCFCMMAPIFVGTHALTASI